MADFDTTVRNLVIAGEDYTLRQIAVLHAIQREDGRSTGELAAELSLSKPAVTRACDKLKVERSLIKRTGDADDRRKVVLTLTKKGTDFLDRIAGGFEPVKKGRKA